VSKQRAPSPPNTYVDKNRQRPNRTDTPSTGTMVPELQKARQASRGPAARRTITKRHHQVVRDSKRKMYTSRRGHGEHDTGAVGFFAKAYFFYKRRRRARRENLRSTSGDPAGIVRPDATMGSRRAANRFLPEEGRRLKSNLENSPASCCSELDPNGTR